ncbi:HAD-IB family phosphatase [Actinoplanes sp. NPDC026619]|uniref:HAD family hydrolase n=1 Tax=Actinoplanes sp. NPDC026619 TaxID=3155798 RepID=UPI0033F0C837
MTVLHVFDMDGTLLAGSTASVQIAAALGSEADLVELERRFAGGELDTRGFAAAICTLWRDLAPELVAAAFAGSPWLAGIDDVCADIRRRGERSAVITMSPNFFAVRLLERGFDEVVASRFPPLPLTAAADPAGILTPADKVRIVDELCARHRIQRRHCVAYGDSMSDAPLFRHLSATVAVNADEHLTYLAAAGYRGHDLTAAYALGRALLPVAE